MSTSITVEIDRPAPVVFDYVTDPSRFSEWQSGVIGGRRHGGDAPEIGDRCVNTRRIGFGTREVTSVITHLDTPRRWAVRGVDGPVRAAVDVLVAPLDNGQRSQVTITIDFTGLGVGKLIVPLVIRRQAEKEMDANMNRLRERLHQTR
jgi:uncharacterized protein YndB with AHSA1/START domain